MSENSCDAPVRFFEASEALEWADEMASRPDVAIATALVLRGLVQIPGRVLGAPTRDELVDWAYTIISALQGVEFQVDRFVYRYIYGCGAVKENIAAIVDEIAEPPGREHRSLKERQVVCLVALRRLRSRFYKNKLLPWAVYARAIGINRQNLSKGGWPDLIQRIEGDLSARILRAERQYTARLEEIGVLSRDRS